MFIKSVREEYQVVKRGREYQDYGEEYNIKKEKVVEEYQIVGNFIHPCSIVAS